MLPATIMVASTKPSVGLKCVLASLIVIKNPACTGFEDSNIKMKLRLQTIFS
jgi:hypothetical protein